MFEDFHCVDLLCVLLREPILEKSLLYSCYKVHVQGGLWYWCKFLTQSWHILFIFCELSLGEVVSQRAFRSFSTLSNCCWNFAFSFFRLSIFFMWCFFVLWNLCSVDCWQIRWTFLKSMVNSRDCGFSFISLACLSYDGSL